MGIDAENDDRRRAKWRGTKEEGEYNGTFVRANA